MSLNNETHIFIDVLDLLTLFLSLLLDTVLTGCCFAFLNYCVSSLEKRLSTSVRESQRLKGKNMSLLFLLWFLLHEVQLSLWVSSHPTTSGHFVPIFGSTSSYDCITLWGKREGMLAVTAGLKYPHDIRVHSNETPDRCLHKLSAAHSLHLPERWGWLWAMTDVCVCVIVSPTMIRVTASCLPHTVQCKGWQLLNARLH